jgi:hypothetical protein
MYPDEVKRLAVQLAKDVTHSQAVWQVAQSPCKYKVQKISYAGRLMSKRERNFLEANKQLGKTSLQLWKAMQGILLTDQSDYDLDAINHSFLGNSLPG